MCWQTTEMRHVKNCFEERNANFLLNRHYTLVEHFWAYTWIVNTFIYLQLCDLPLNNTKNVFFLKSIDCNHLCRFYIFVKKKQKKKNALPNFPKIVTYIISFSSGIGVSVALGYRLSDYNRLHNIQSIILYFYYIIFCITNRIIRQWCIKIITNKCLRNQKSFK